VRESEEGCLCQWPVLVQGAVHAHCSFSGGAGGERGQAAGLFLVLPTQGQARFSFPFYV